MTLQPLLLWKKAGQPRKNKGFFSSSPYNPCRRKENAPRKTKKEIIARQQGNQRKQELVGGPGLRIVLHDSEGILPHQNPQERRFFFPGMTGEQRNFCTKNLDFSNYFWRSGVNPQIGKPKSDPPPLAKIS